MHLSLRYFSVIFCSLNIYQTIISPHHAYKTSNLIYSFVLSWGIIPLVPTTFLRIIITLFSSCIYSTFISKINLRISLLSTIICYGFSFCLYSLSINLLGILFILFFPNYINTSYTFS